MVVRRICPDSLSREQDDLVQIATMKVWEKVGSEGNQVLNSSYIGKAAHSVLIDEIRRMRRRKEVELSGTEEMVEGSKVHNPEIRTASLEAGKAIRNCLSTLVQSRRRAVTAYLLGHSVPEAARLLRWSPKKTENLVYRGLAQLRTCLNQKGVTP